MVFKTRLPLDADLYRPDGHHVPSAALAFLASWELLKTHPLSS
jgi:hypothetical protein